MKRLLTLVALGVTVSTAPAHDTAPCPSHVAGNVVLGLDAVVPALSSPLVPPAPTDVPTELLTVAERSDYRATARHAEVMALMERLAERSDAMTLTELGRSHEDRPLPLMIVADPPVADAEAARRDDRLRILLVGNIHAGEVCGKEALLMLLRELALDPEHPWLDDAIFLVAPIYNADGNERMDPGNRPGQVGPVDGMGQRPNAQNLDLNRDWMKLEAPETRAMVRLLTAWDPHLTVDTHTTNGSYHRYELTYDVPLHPSADADLVAFLRRTLLPAAAEQVRKRTDYDTFYYGNFNRDQTVWTTYSAEPRFGGPYMGLRGQMSVLSEAYAYAPYRDRVLVTRAFVRALVDQAIIEQAAIRNLHVAARLRTTLRGADPDGHDLVGLRHRPAAFSVPVTMKGWVMAPDERGRPRPTDAPKDYTVIHRGRFEATDAVRRPFAYLIPPGCDNVVDLLAAHGIRTEAWSGTARTEPYTITGVRFAARALQGHRLADLDVASGAHTRAWPAGSVLVRTAQPLGTLAVTLLEPRAVDGVAAWNMLDDALAVGGAFPIERVTAAADLAPVDPPAAFGVTATPDGVTVTVNGALFARYNVNDGNTPYLWPLIGPTGAPVTRAYPMGPVEGSDDHPHHRSLWFGHQSVNGVDTWHDGRDRPVGATVHRAFRRTEARADSAVLETVNDIVDADGRVLGADERRFVFRVFDDHRTVDVTITLRALDETLTLADAKDAGLALRVADSMRVDAGSGGRIVNAEGRTDASAWSRRSRWCSYSGPVRHADGATRTLGIAVLDHPSSFRHPAAWHVRTYGLLTANPFFPNGPDRTRTKTAAVLRPGEAITMRYRIVLHTGTADEVDLDALWSAFAHEPQT